MGVTLIALEVQEKVMLHLILLAFFLERKCDIHSIRL